MKVLILCLFIVDNFSRVFELKKFNLSIDSLLDIAINKLFTIYQRCKARDYIDLYYILTQKKYPLAKLILDAKAKFDWDIDRVTLSSQFLKAKDLKDKELPRMLIPFDKQKMENFFVNLAKDLEGEIFK